jgi:hypothetical protein
MDGFRWSFEGHTGFQDLSDRPKCVVRPHSHLSCELALLSCVEVETHFLVRISEHVVVRSFDEGSPLSSLSDEGLDIVYASLLEY